MGQVDSPTLETQAGNGLVFCADSPHSHAKLLQIKQQAVPDNAVLLHQEHLQDMLQSIYHFFACCDYFNSRKLAEPVEHLT